jgi:hypothetical protein
VAEKAVYISKSKCSSFGALSEKARTVQKKQPTLEFKSAFSMALLEKRAHGKADYRSTNYCSARDEKRELSKVCGRFLGLGPVHPGRRQCWSRATKKASWGRKVHPIMMLAFLKVFRKSTFEF